MAFDLSTANMRDVIAQSHLLHPSMLRDALQSCARTHAAARDTFAGVAHHPARVAAQNAAKQCGEAICALDRDELAFFTAENLGATVQAFGCAAQLLCVPRSLWTDIAGRSLELTAEAIARKWVAKLGLGFHPDTRGEDYVGPALTSEEAAEYDSDMERLFVLAPDPYAVGLAAMEAAGLPVG